MKLFITALSIGILVGGAVGFAGGIVVFPYLFPPPEVNEIVVIAFFELLVHNAVATTSVFFVFRSIVLICFLFLKWLYFA